MYKYERSDTHEKADNLKINQSKPNFGDVPEFKHGFSEKAEINAGIAMGISSGSEKTSSVYLRGIESDKENHAIQLSGKPPRPPIRIKGSSRRHQAPPAPPPRQQVELEFYDGPQYCSDDQKMRILQNPRQGMITDINTNEVYFHFGGRYNSGIGKPIWRITADNKIEVIGMYRHARNSNKVYQIVRGHGPNTIQI